MCQAVDCLLSTASVVLLDRTQCVAEAVNPNPVIPKFQVTVNRNNGHVTARAIGVVLLSANVCWRVMARIVAPYADRAVMSCIIPAQRLMWVVTGHA